jgi:hypothetical protein
MKSNFFVVLFVFFCLHLHAEIRQGVVFDANTRQPVARASVYINNSKIGTSCNDEGVFFLHGFPKPPYKINISAIGYETTVIEIPKTSDYNSITIFIKPKTLELAEFVVKSPEKNGWELYGQEFIEEFIGYSDFAKQCRIRNPEILWFFYDKENLVLRVYAEKPLIIDNNASGYKITYWLDDFEKNYKTRKLFYRGYSQFEDLITEKTRRNRAARWQANREAAYKGSIYHFIASLYHNRTEDEGFQVRPLKRVSEEQAFENAEKNTDTIYFDEENLQLLEKNFYEKYNQMGLFSNLQDAAEKCIRNLKEWYYDTTNFSVGRFKFHNPNIPKQISGSNLTQFEILEFRKDTTLPNQIVRSQYISDTASIIDKDNIITQRKFLHGKYELLYRLINPETLVQTTSDEKKIFAFQNHLQIIYKNEIEEKPYLRRIFGRNEFEKVPQTSTISLHEADEITIFPNGHFEPPYVLLLEHYWAYEKLDKLLPLDFRAEK